MRRQRTQSFSPFEDYLAEVCDAESRNTRNRVTELVDIDDFAFNGPGVHVWFRPIQAYVSFRRRTKLRNCHTERQMGRDWRKHIPPVKCLADRLEKVAFVLQSVDRFDFFAV